MVKDALRAFKEYEWIHMTLGLVGNILFFTGSILFLLNLEPIGIRAFILGSFLMLINSLGSLLVKYARNDL